MSISTELYRRRSTLLDLLWKEIETQVEKGHAYLKRLGRFLPRGAVGEMDQYFTGGVRPFEQGQIAAGGLNQVLRVELKGGNVPEEFRTLVRKDFIVPPGLIAEYGDLEQVRDDDYFLGLLSKGGPAREVPGEIIQRLQASPFATLESLLEASQRRKGEQEAHMSYVIQFFAEQMAKPLWLSADRHLADITLETLGHECVVRDKQRENSVRPSGHSISVSRIFEAILERDGPTDGEAARISVYQKHKPYTLEQALDYELGRFKKGDAGTRGDALRALSTILTGLVHLYKERHDRGWYDLDAKPANVLAERDPKEGWKFYLIDQGGYTPSESRDMLMTREEKQGLDISGGMSTKYAPARRVRATMENDLDEASTARAADDGAYAALAHATFFGAYQSLQQRGSPLSPEVLRDHLDCRARFADDPAVAQGVPAELRSYVQFVQHAVRSDLAGKPIGIHHYYEELTSIAFNMHKLG